MAQIYETENFIVESFERPHVDRLDGGHIKIAPKKHLADRTQLSPKLAIEFMRLTMVAGEAFETAMNNCGIPVVKINYQDMGNWAYKTGGKPLFHLHLYGRASNAVWQIFPESVYLPDRSTGFYDKFEPLNENDIKEIQKQIEIISQKEKYKKENWGL
ncbi:MAG: hypothetical protein WCJ51_01730 [Candidatus Moraniibacteriota bacterium]